MHITERYPRETGRDYALRTLKDNIVRLELAPGSMVSENELAATLGLSRTPVREALIELSKVKIVEIFPQRGSAVAKINYAMVEESQFMRNVLECAVVELVCQRATAEDIRRLDENVRLQRFYLENYNADIMELDNQFHKILFEIAGKSQVHDLMSHIQIHFDRVRQLALKAVKPDKIIRDHEDLIAAIAAKDQLLARQIMEKHLSRYKFDIVAIQEQYPQYF